MSSQNKEQAISFLEKFIIQLKNYKNSISELEYFQNDLLNQLKSCPELIELTYLDQIKDSLAANDDLISMIQNNADIILRLSDQMKMYSGETENEYDTTFIQSRYLQLQDFEKNVLCEKKPKNESIDSFMKIEDSNESNFLSEKHIKKGQKIFFQDRIKYEETNKENFNGKKRGPYRKYSASIKKEALDILHNSKNNGANSTKSISRRLKIPCNTLKRWLRVGIYRKRGAGRKLMDPKMEENLKNWCFEKIKNQEKLESKEIRKAARTFSKFPSFKASKGWLAGFIKRIGLETKVDCKQKIEIADYIVHSE